jgi:hypothetical protein
MNYNPTIDRRKFLQGAAGGTALATAARFGLLSLAAGTELALTGCNFVQDIINWVPVAENAINSILTILTSNGILISPAITAGVSLIETALTDLVAAAKEYESITPAPVGAKAKLEAILQVVADQFSSFVSQLGGIAGVVLTTVVDLVKVLISTIGGFINELPASAAMMARLNSHQQLSAAPVKRTKRAFKKAWNAQLDVASGHGVSCPTGAYLHIGFFEHF